MLLITRNSILGKMRDFNFVSIKIQSFFGVKFLKKQINFFHKCSLKYFLTTFLLVSLFRMSEFCLFLFYSVQQAGFLSRMTGCLFYVLNADQ